MLLQVSGVSGWLCAMNLFFVPDDCVSSWELQQPHMVPPLSWHMPVKPWLVCFCRLLQ